MIIFKINKVTVLILFFVIFVFSCEYQPTEQYVVNVTKPTEVPPINVDLNLMTDTINVYWQSHIILKIKYGNKNVLAVKFYVDDIEIFGDKIESVFYIPVYFYGPGTHKFRMTIITNTDSGSLADILGAEVFRYDSREWSIITKKVNEDFNLSFKPEMNGILFSWKEFDGINFKTYRIKDLSTKNSYDILTNSFHNSDYTGAQGYFEVYVVDIDNKEHLWGKCFLNKSLPVLSSVNINNYLTLIWNKTPYVNNIAEYQLFKRDKSTNWTKIATISNSDTSILINNSLLNFGQVYSFYLYCVPKHYTFIDNTSIFCSYLDNVGATLPGPIFENNIGADCSGFYFYRYSSEKLKYILYKYTISTDQIKSICDFNFDYDISSGFKYFMIHDDSILNLCDLYSNNIIKSVDIFKEVNVEYILNPKISDNGTCVFISEYNIYVYDLLNERLIATKSAMVDQVKISPNGKFISVENSDSVSFYRIDENSLSFMSGLAKTSWQYLSENINFLPNQDDYIYLFMAPFMHIMSCHDLSVVRSMNIGEDFYNIDFCTNKIFTGASGNNWKIYDFNTGNLLRTIKSEFFIGGRSNTVLINNTIYFTGYKFYLHD